MAHQNPRNSRLPQVSPLRAGFLKARKSFLEKLIPPQIRCVMESPHGGPRTATTVISVEDYLVIHL